MSSGARLIVRQRSRSVRPSNIATGDRDTADAPDRAEHLLENRVTVHNQIRLHGRERRRYHKWLGSELVRYVAAVRHLLPQSFRPEPDAYGDNLGRNVSVDPRLRRRDRYDGLSRSAPGGFCVGRRLLLFSRRSSRPSGRRRSTRSWRSGPTDPGRIGLARSTRVRQLGERARPAVLGAPLMA